MLMDVQKSGFCYLKMSVHEKQSEKRYRFNFKPWHKVESENTTRDIAIEHNSLDIV